MKKDFKNSKAAQFIKKNVYYIVMVACVIAIATMVTFAVVLNQPVKGGGNTIIDKPSITDPETPDVPGGNPGENPGEDVDTPSVMVFVSPLKNPQILRGYSPESAVWNPTLKHFAVHDAIDYKANAGEKVMSVYDGTVESVLTDELSGTVVTILHKDNIRSIYGSLTNVTVKVGDLLKKGAEFADASNSMGTEKLDGVHLHFQMSVNGEITDPSTFLVNSDK